MNHYIFEFSASILLQRKRGKGFFPFASCTRAQLAAGKKARLAAVPTDGSKGL